MIGDFKFDTFDQIEYSIYYYTVGKYSLESPGSGFTLQPAMTNKDLRKI